MRCLAKVMTTAAVVLGLTNLSACGNPSSQAELSSASSGIVDAATLFRASAALDPAVRKQIINELRHISVEDYYQWVAARLTNDPVLVGNKVTHPAADWVQSHHLYTDIGARYGTLGELWQAMHIDPEHVKLSDVQAGSGPSLGLGDRYLANQDGHDCNSEFSLLRGYFEVAPEAVAAAYSNLPVSGKKGYQRIGESEIGISGTQQKAKPNQIVQKATSGSFGYGADAAKFIWDQSNKKIGQSSTFFSRCLKRPDAIPSALPGLIPVYSPDEITPSTIAVPDTASTSAAAHEATS